MAKEKTKIREITIKESDGTFSLFRKKGISKKDYDFSGILALRQILSNERARILDAVKTQKPISVYDLAKKLGRTFKSVSMDINLLKRFGIIDLLEEKTKNRVRYKPILVAEKIIINLKI